MTPPAIYEAAAQRRTQAATAAKRWRRLRRIVFWLAIIPALWALWAAGYAEGYLDGSNFARKAGPQ